MSLRRSLQQSNPQAFIPSQSVYPHPSLALPLDSCCSCCVSQCPFTWLAPPVFIPPFIQGVAVHGLLFRLLPRAQLHLKLHLNLSLAKQASDVFLSWEDGEALEKAQKSCGCLILAGVLGQGGWACDKLDLVEGALARGRAVEAR